MRWAWFFAGMTLGLLVAGGALLTGWLPLATAAAQPTPVAQAAQPSPTATALPPPSLTGGPPVATPVSPQSAAAPTPSTQVKRGEVVSSGDWKAAVNDVRLDAQRVLVDWTIKNDSRSAGTLSIPSTAPSGPRNRPASLHDVQIAGAPTLELWLVDPSERAFGGSFVSSNGQSSGGFTFVAAPGDAIRMTYSFELPPSGEAPKLLDLRFRGDAGGARARVKLDERAEPPVVLEPSDYGKVAGKGERVEVGSTWAFTLTALEVSEPGLGGERLVTARLRAQNRSDLPLVPAGTEDDPTGSERDFYVVDSAVRMAYSSSDTMPRTSIPPGQTRDVEVRMRAPTELSKVGPHRFSIVVDAEDDEYAVFRVP